MMARKPIRDIDIGITCDGAAANQKCTAQAAYVVRAHFIDHCQVNWKTLDADGRWSALLCAQCTAVMLQTNAELLEGGPVQCCACHERFTTLHDVIQVDHLNTGASIT